MNKWEVVFKNFYHHTKMFNFTCALAYCIHKTLQTASQPLKCYIHSLVHYILYECFANILHMTICLKVSL